MPSFMGDFQEQTVREIALGLLSVMFKGSAYGFSILDCETFVLQEHFDRHAGHLLSSKRARFSAKIKHRENVWRSFL